MNIYLKRLYVYENDLINTSCSTENCVELEVEWRSYVNIIHTGTMDYVDYMALSTLSKVRKSNFVN